MIALAGFVALVIAYFENCSNKNMKLPSFVSVDDKNLTNGWKILVVYSIIFLVVVTETGTSFK